MAGITYKHPNWHYLLVDPTTKGVKDIGATHHYPTLRKKQQLALRSGWIMTFGPSEKAQETH